MVDRGCRHCFRTDRILFLDSFSSATASYSSARLAHLPESLVGCGGRALLPDGWVREQGCASPRHEFALLDADLLCDAGGHWRRALLPVASAGGFAVPGLRHPHTG